MAKKEGLTLIALDIQGEWNLPQLTNAAELSGASLQYCKSGKFEALAAPTNTPFSEIRNKFSAVIACETGVKARNIFQFPSPRGNIALVVGNEEKGIPKSVLKQCSDIVTLPMPSRSLTSVNVAASASACLYIIQRDLARQGGFQTNRRNQNIFDLAILAPEDPAECGSIIRSAGAFGFRRVYLHDPFCSWFSDNREKITLSRAAARREVNPVHIKPFEELDASGYSKVINFSRIGTGLPLSRYRMKNNGQILITLGFENVETELSHIPQDDIFIDFADSSIYPKPRHEACIALSVLTNQIIR